jgi:hypothetical protein
MSIKFLKEGNWMDDAGMAPLMFSLPEVSYCLLHILSSSSWFSSIQSSNPGRYMYTIFYIIFKLIFSLIFFFLESHLHGSSLFLSSTSHWSFLVPTSFTARSFCCLLNYFWGLLQSLLLFSGEVDGVTFKWPSLAPSSKLLQVLISHLPLTNLLQSHLPVPRTLYIVLYNISEVFSSVIF